MRDHGSNEPVTGNQGGEGIVITENSVWDRCFPYISFYMGPAFYRFAARDMGLTFWGGAVGDPFGGSSGIARINSLPVDTRCNKNFITWKSFGGSF